MKYTQIIIFVLIFFVKTLSGQRAFFEKDEILIGDQILFSLEIPEDIGNDIIFPDLNDTLIAGIEIIKESDLLNIRGEENYLIKEYTITSFDDSLFLLYPFEFLVDGKIIKSNPVRLKVSSFIPDSSALSKIDTTGQFPLFDIEGTINTPLTFNEFIHRFWVYILGIFLVIAAFFIYRYFKKRKRLNQTPVKNAEIIRPAHETTLEQLDELKNKELHKKEDLKPFYSELSMIIRSYIEKRFNIDAVESVTSEIINEFLKTEYADEKTLNNLNELLGLSDLVKFAKRKPNEEENEMMIEYAYFFVNHTKKHIIDETENQQSL